MTGKINEKDAEEVVPKSKGEGHTRGTSKSSRLCVTSKIIVPPLLQGQTCEFESASNSINTVEFKEDVVNYATVEVGNSRSCEAAQQFGGIQRAAQDCITTHQSGVENLSQKDNAKAFKQAVVKYALEVVPGGKGKGGRRGMDEAGIVYGVPHNTVYRWTCSQLFCTQSIEKKVSSTSKSEVVRYALEEAMNTGSDKVAIHNASKKFLIEPAIINGWIRHSKRLTNNYAG